MTWFEAKDHCESEGGKLVEINSSEENTALVDEIKSKGYSNQNMNMNFWMGLTDLGNEGDWILASNSLKPPYTNWDIDTDQPNNGGGNEHCARIRTKPNSDSDTWSDLDCNSTRAAYSPLPSMHALCEFDSPKESSLTLSKSQHGQNT